MSDLPNLDHDLLRPSPTQDAAAPRILLLYGSNRERSFSRLLVQEAAEALSHPGGLA